MGGEYYRCVRSYARFDPTKTVTEKHEAAYLALQPELLLIIDDWRVAHDTPDWSYEAKESNQLVRVEWKGKHPDPSQVSEIVLPRKLGQDDGPWEIGWNSKRFEDPKRSLADKLIDAFLRDPVLRGVVELDEMDARFDDYPSYDDYDNDNDSEKDFTACDKECGYCGHCDY